MICPPRASKHYGGIVKGGRLQHIDAMRAIAVLLVVWTHYSEAFVNFAGSQFYLDDIQKSVNFGRIGVVLFFAISGFLIPSSLGGETGEGSRRFLTRRFFRLFPAYWVSLPLGYLTVWWLYDRSLAPMDIVAGFSMVQGLLGFEHIMGHYWTLETELIFYAACLGLFWTGTIRQFRVLATVSTLLVVCFCVVIAMGLIPDTWHGAYKGLLFHIAIMFWGACIRCAYDGSIKSSDRKILVGVTGLILAIGAAISIKGLLASDFAHVSSGLAYILGVAAFLFFLLVWKIEIGAAAWMGRISYSLYLLHPVALYAVSWFCMANGITGLPLGAYMVVTLIPAVGLAWWSFYFVEQTGIDISYRLTGARVAAHAAP